MESGNEDSTRRAGAGPLRHRLMGLCIGLALLTGCARWTEVIEPLPPIKAFPSVSIPAEERVPVLVKPVQLTHNGTKGVPSPDLERRMLDLLQDTHLFSQLVQTGYAQLPVEDKVMTARLVVSDEVDSHASGAAFKGLMIGASMFLLTPLLPLEYDYNVYMDLELERWDGQIKRYRSSSKGTAYYHLFGATPVAITDLKAQVTQSCMTALKRQLVQDGPFYLVQSAPFPSSSPAISAVELKGPVGSHQRAVLTAE